MIETFACATFYLISELKRRPEGRNPGNREEWGDDAIVVDEW